MADETKPQSQLKPEDETVTVPGVEELGVEVAKRSGDQPKDNTTQHRKVYVVKTSDYDVVDKKAFHEANERALRQAMIAQGLRAKGTISNTAKKDAPSTGSTSVTYTLEATIAGVDSYDVEHQDVGGETPPVA